MDVRAGQQPWPGAIIGGRIVVTDASPSGLGDESLACQGTDRYLVSSGPDSALASSN